MNNLTEKQELIIAEITNEFNKINEEKKKSNKGGLLKLNELVEQKDNDLESRKIIELNNEACFKNFLCIVDDSIEKLNDELLDYGLKAYKLPKNYTAQSSLNGIYFYIDLISYSNGEKSSKYGIRIKAENEVVYQTFKSNIEGIQKYVNFRGFKLEGSYTFAYKNIEEFVEKSSVRNNINYLLHHS